MDLLIHIDLIFVITTIFYYSISNTQYAVQTQAQKYTPKTFEFTTSNSKDSDSQTWKSYHRITSKTCLKLEDFV